MASIWVTQEMPTTLILAEFVRFLDRKSAVQFCYFNTPISENFRIILVPGSGIR